MAYVVLTLVAVLCWVLAANSNLGLAGSSNPNAARFSIYTFIILGLIQMIGRAVIASREVPMRISGMRKAEPPELVLTGRLFIEDMISASQISPIPEDHDTATKSTDLDAKRLSDILND